MTARSYVAQLALNEAYEQKTKLSHVNARRATVRLIAYLEMDGLVDEGTCKRLFQREPLDLTATIRPRT